MSSTPAEAAGAARMLVFQVGEQAFCLDVTLLKEIRGWSQETLIPGAPAYLRGVINLRGSVLPIVDIGARLDLPVCTPDSRHVVVVVSVDHRLAGLVVNSVEQIVSVPAAAFAATPEVASATVREMVSGLVTIAGRTIAVVALAQVIAALRDEAA